MDGDFVRNRRVSRSRRPSRRLRHRLFDALSLVAAMGFADVDSHPVRQRFHLSAPPTGSAIERKALDRPTISPSSDVEDDRAAAPTNGPMTAIASPFRAIVIGDRALRLPRRRRHLDLGCRPTPTAPRGLRDVARWFGQPDPKFVHRPGRAKAR